MSKNIFLSVVAPVFNEEENIERVLRYWNEVLESADFHSEIVITNDGSQDKTADIVDALKKDIPRLKVVSHDINGGYGRALSSSIKHSSGEWVLTLDSDGQFDVAEYEILLNKARSENLDGVTGFRKQKKDTFIKVFADRVLNKIVKFMFKVQFTDTNCALKLVKGDIIRGINFEARGYPTPTEIVIKLAVSGARIGEAGITHSEREGGLSKLNPVVTGFNFLRFLLYLKLKTNLYNNKILNTL